MTTAPLEAIPINPSRPKKRTIRPYTLPGLLLALLCKPFWRGERASLVEARIKLTRERATLRRVQRERARTQRSDSLKYALIIQHRLAYLGQVSISEVTAKKRKPRIFTVEFDALPTSDEILWYKIRTRKWRWRSFASVSALPRGVRVKDLMNDDMAWELSIACGHTVTWQCDTPEHGAWFLVHRLKKLHDIPELVKFEDMLPHYPDDLSALPFVVGVGKHRRVQTIFLEEIPHGLVAGPTMCGKSNFINALILQLMYFYTPQQLQFVLIDLKKVEFEDYVGSPHLFQPIVSDRQKAFETLQYLDNEIQRRLDLITGGAKDVRRWNVKFPDRALPYLFCIIDEYAQLVNTGDPKLKAKTNALVADISARGRAAGVQIIVCTQQPTKEIVASEIKANLNLRVAGRCVHHTQSGIILGLGDAAWLPDVKGRFIYLSGADLIEIQAPYVRPEDTRYVLQVALGRAAGLTRLDGHEIMPEPAGLNKLAVEKFEGRLSRAFFAEVMGYGVDKLSLASYVEQLAQYGAATVDSALYTVGKQDNEYVLSLAPGQTLPIPEPVLEPETLSSQTTPEMSKDEAGESLSQTPEPAQEPGPQPSVVIEHLTPIELWLIDEYRDREAGKTSNEQLRFDYVTWCVKHGIETMERDVFFKALRDMGYQPYQSNGVRYMRGLERKVPAVLSTSGTTDEYIDEVAAR